MAKRAKNGESTKTDSLTVRLAPRLKFGLDILARYHRRTASGVLETLLDNALDEFKTRVNTSYIWHPVEAIRTARMDSPTYKYLLTMEEEMILAQLPIIFENPNIIEELKDETCEIFLLVDLLWDHIKEALYKNKGRIDVNDIARFKKMIGK